MTTTQKLLRALLLVASVAMLAGVAHADDLAEAKRYFEEGRKSYQLGEYAKAIAAHKRSFELSGNAVLLFNLGQSYRKLGDNAQALHFYKQFVATDPKGRMRQDADEHIQRLEALAANADRTKAAPPNQLEPTPDAAPPPHVTPSSLSVSAAIVVPTEPSRKPNKNRGLIIGASVGAVVVVGLALGLGLGLGLRDNYYRPSAGSIEGN